MARPTPHPARRPTLFIIGGAEDRGGSSSVLRRFTRLAGGRRGRIVLVPTASSTQHKMVTAYTEVFSRLGVPSVSAVNPASRADAGRPEDVRALDEATGIFLTGGSQLRLSQRFLGTPLEAALHRAHERGCVVGGTSAGASVMSQFMISMGDEAASPRQRLSQLSAGLGLIKGVVIDQHFAQRRRYGRLMAVCAASPSLAGIGIDENTAIEVGDGSMFTVHGSGTAFVIDCRAAVTDAPEARRGAPLLVSGAVVHALPAGATFDLSSMTLVDFVEKHADIEVTLATAKA